MNRPSHRELTGKLTQARDAVSQNSIAIINSLAVAADAVDLGYEVSEIQSVLDCILKEISPVH